MKNLITEYDEHIERLEQQIQKMKDNAHHAVHCLTDDDGYPYPDNHLTNLALEYLSKVKGEDYRHGPDYHDEQ